MCQQQWLSHKSHPTFHALVWLFLAMNESMSVAIIPTIKQLATNFTRERLYSGMNPHVLLEVLRIHKCRTADITFVRSFAGVCRLYVIFEQATSLKRPLALCALVLPVIEVRHFFVGSQIGSLGKCHGANVTFERPLAGVRSFVIVYFSSSCKSLTTSSTNKRLISRMDNFVNVQIMLRSEGLLANFAYKRFHSSVQLLVLYQILLVQKRFVTLIAAVGSWSFCVDLHVCLERIFWGKIFIARWAFIWPLASVHVHMFVE